MERSILLLLAHPAFEKSRANRALLNAVQGLDGVHIHDLYEEYPDFAVDVKREQSLLAEHDLIVVQHPFYWYSVPALLKEWIDLVFEYGFAFGEEGRALEGKLWLSAVTAGGSEDSYCRAGGNRYTVRELLAPLEQTARLCRMQFLPPFFVFGTHGLRDSTDFDSHGAQYRTLLVALRDGKLGPADVAGRQTLWPGGVSSDG